VGYTYHGDPGTGYCTTNYTRSTIGCNSSADCTNSPGSLAQYYGGGTDGCAEATPKNVVVSCCSDFTPTGTCSYSYRTDCGDDRIGGTTTVYDGSKSMKLTNPSDRGTTFFYSDCMPVDHDEQISSLTI
jgi:hypothetical protein